MRIIVVLAVVVMLSIFSISTGIHSVQALVSSASPQSERFFINREFWAFGGTYVMGSFNANAGDYIVLNISSVNIDPDRPDDRYVVELGINSTKYGISYVSGTQFRQTISLNYTDYYTITAEKHQFWSSVKVSGEVTVYHNQMTNSSSPVPAISFTPNPSSSLNPDVSPTPEAPELPPLVILPTFILAVSTVIILRTIVKTNRREGT